MAKNFNIDEVLENKIYININNWTFYILFNYMIYQYNWDVVEANIQDMEFLHSDDYIKINDFNINYFYDYLISYVDVYKITNDNNFFKKGRLLKIIQNNDSQYGIIYEAKFNELKNWEYEIFSIDVLNEEGNIITIWKDYVYNILYPVANELDIKIDIIIEILWYYNMSNIDINYSEFIN